MNRYYAIEAVTVRHQDKLCDLIADSSLDECPRVDSISIPYHAAPASKEHASRDARMGMNIG